MTVDDDYNALVETLDTINGKLAAMKTARFFTERQRRADTDSNSHFAPHPIKWRKLDLSH